MSQNVCFKSKWSNGWELLPCLGQRSLIPSFEIFSCLPNFLKFVIWITLPHNHQSSTCRPVRPSVTMQLSLLPLCAEILSSWKSQWLSSSKIPKTREGSEHTLPCVSAFEPDVSSQIPRWFPGLRTSLFRNLLKYLCPLPVCGVKLQGACRGWQWHRHPRVPGSNPSAASQNRNLSKEGALVTVNFAEYLPKSMLGPSMAQQCPAPCRGAAAALSKRGTKSESSPRTSCR